MCGKKKKKPSEYKHWTKDSQLNPLKLILCWLFQVPVLSICKQYLNTFTTAALQVDNFSLIKKKTFISSFLVIMKVLEAKILSEWILNPWIFLNNTQNALSIWSFMDINNEFWVVLDGHCINRAHMTKESMVPQSPLYEPWGVNVLASLSECEASDTQTVMWFSRTLLCCGNDMIWICLLTNTISVACNYYNVEPQRVYKHCHEINTLDFSFRCLWFYAHIHTFELKKINTCITGYIIKQFHPYNFLQSSTLLLITLEFVKKTHIW